MQEFCRDSTATALADLHAGRNSHICAYRQRPMSLALCTRRHLRSPLRRAHPPERTHPYAPDAAHRRHKEADQKGPWGESSVSPRLALLVGRLIVSRPTGRAFNVSARMESMSHRRWPEWGRGCSADISGDHGGAGRARCAHGLELAPWSSEDSGVRALLGGGEAKCRPSASTPPHRPKLRRIGNRAGHGPLAT